MAPSPARSPRVRDILSPFLQGLPAAAISNTPPKELLALLTPILRHRVEYLSASSSSPWLRLLCYDSVKADRLEQIAASSAFEPHPVSGEVEVECDLESADALRYRRFDEETLQAAVSVAELGLLFKLQHEGGEERGGWCLAELSATEGDATFAAFGGHASIEAAETAFRSGQSKKRPGSPLQSASNININREVAEEDEADDDDYWGRYDESASRTPAPNPSPAPPALRAAATSESARQAAEDNYFAQYDNVQPAMDRDDPDGHVEGLGPLTPPLYQPQAPENLMFESVVVPPTQQHTDDHWAEVNSKILRPAARPNSSGDLPSPWSSNSSHHRSRSDSLAVEAAAARRDDADMVHPRPSSSAGSSGSHTVALLEESAKARGEGEFGVRQHVSRSIRSLYLLARAAHIDRDEFETIIRTELDLLGVLDDSPAAVKNGN